MPTKQAKAKTCWDFWNCKPERRDACLAFTTDSGDDCWNLVGSFTRHTDQCHCPKQQTCFKFCWECPWFKKENPNYVKKS